MPGRTNSDLIRELQVTVTGLLEREKATLQSLSDLEEERSTATEKIHQIEIRIVEELTKISQKISYLEKQNDVLEALKNRSVVLETNLTRTEKLLKVIANVGS